MMSIASSRKLVCFLFVLGFLSFSDVVLSFYCFSGERYREGKVFFKRLDKVTISGDGSSWIACTYECKFYFGKMSSEEVELIPTGNDNIYDIAVSYHGEYLAYNTIRNIKLLQYQKESKQWKEKEVFSCNHLVRYGFTPNASLMMYSSADDGIWEGKSYSLSTKKTKLLPPISCKVFFNISPQGALLWINNAPDEEKELCYICLPNDKPKYWGELTLYLGCFSKSFFSSNETYFISSPIVGMNSNLGIYDISSCNPKNLLHHFSDNKQIHAIGSGPEASIFTFMLNEKRRCEAEQYYFLLWDVKNNKKCSDYYAVNGKSICFFAPSPCHSCFFFVERFKLIKYLWVPIVPYEKIKLIQEQMITIDSSWIKDLSILVVDFLGPCHWHLEHLWEK